MMGVSGLLKYKEQEKELEKEKEIRRKVVKGNE